MARLATKPASATIARTIAHTLQRPDVALKTNALAYTKAWRTALAAARVELHTRYLAKPEPAPHLREIAALTDALIANLADDIGLPSNYALVAVGGYGRGYLYPASDVDVVILLPEDVGPDASVEKFVSLLWDVGIEPGIAVRSIRECVEEAQKDVTVDTSLLEARAIWGDASRVRALDRALREARDLQKFFDAKIGEQKKRHARHHDVALNLEPNIKESPGGLRDLQMLLWLSKAAQLGDDWSALAANGLLTRDEAKHVTAHRRVLMDLRVRLHYLSGRREDRLVFDHQAALARDLNLKPTKGKSASEILMQRYYLTAKAIWQMNSILLPNLVARISKRKTEIRPINDEFELQNGNIAARDEGIFQRDPRTIFRAFLALQRVKEAEFFAPETLRALWRAVPLIGPEFRADPEANRLFLEILRHEKLSFTLRRMSRYGVLGRYLPAFGRIVGQMQHDLFHVYSVDEHILMVVRNLRRLVSPRFAHEFPFCHELARDFARPEILYLGALFHDIAKGRGGDHSELGKRDARAFCKKIGVSKVDADLVAWLVETHLQMSSIAQKQDLADPEVIAQFAAKVGNERRLTALYLLTVADIRGTSPHVWNTWKAKLLEDLFRSTRRLLRGDAMPNEHWIESNKAEVLKRFRGGKRNDDTAPATIPALWQFVDDSYFQRFDATELTWHVDTLEDNASPANALVKVHAPEDMHAESGFAVMVMTKDQPGLFARITGFFDWLAYDIAAAKVFTTRHGYALDMFQVLPKRGKAESNADVVAVIEHELAKLLDGKTNINAINAGRVARQVKHFPIEPVITLHPSRRQPFYDLSISCADRPGLLSSIARVLLEHEVNLRDARISTLGQRAEDVFVIESQRLTDKFFCSALTEKLVTEIRLK
jgi:[protein-PII] uridylyltransferase